MLQVGGVLGDEAEVALLLLGLGVKDTAESKGDGLLVGEHSKVLALEIVAKVLDGKVDGQELGSNALFLTSGGRSCLHKKARGC